MSHRCELAALRVAAQKVREMRHRARVSERSAFAPIVLSENLALRAARDEMRRGVNALDLSADLGFECAVAIRKQQELNARRARVQNQNALAAHDTAF